MMILKRLRILSLLCVVLASVHAQVSPRPAEEQEALTDALASAASLPIEYRADIVFQIIDSDRLKDAKAKLHALESVYRSAGLAVHPHKRLHVLDQRDVESSLVFSQSLDQLSIRVRAAESITKVDAARGRTLLEEIRMDVPRVGCLAPSVPNTADYYLALGRFLKQPPKQGAARREYLLGLEKPIVEITSPTQLSAGARLLHESGLDRQGLERLVFGLISQFGKLTASDRELDAILRLQGLHEQVSTLAEKMRAEGLPVFGLLQAYRGFLVRSATDEACPDASADRQKAAEGFNALLAEHHLLGSIESLKPAEMKPRKVGPAAKVDLIPEPTEFRGAFTPLIGFSRAWQRKAANLDMESWESFTLDRLGQFAAIDATSSPCRPCRLEMKKSLLLALVHFAPDGRARQRVIDTFIQFLASDPLQTEDPMRWLPPIKVVLNFARKPSAEQLERIATLQKQGKVLTMLPSDYGEEIRKSIERSGNGILLQYFRVETLLNPPYEMPPF